MIRVKYASLALLMTLVLVAACAPRPQPTTAPIAVSAQNTSQPAVTYTPYPTYTLYPTHTPYPTYTPLPTATPTHTPTPAISPTVTEEVVMATDEPELTRPSDEPSPPAAQVSPVDAPAVSVAPPSLELERFPDNDPGPPFAILVDDIRIKENGYYKLTGRVRNDGTEIYEGVGVHASFFDDERKGYGPVDVYCPCPFLEPGAECPFSLAIFPRDYVAYHLHPRGRPVVYRQPATVSLGSLSISNDGIGNVRVTGTATNDNEFTIKNPTIAGVLIDGSGRIISVGSTTVLGDVAPSASVSFDLRIEHEPYSAYQLSAQATRE